MLVCNSMTLIAPLATLLPRQMARLQYPRHCRRVNSRRRHPPLPQPRPWFVFFFLKKGPIRGLRHQSHGPPSRPPRPPFPLSPVRESVSDELASVTRRTLQDDELKERAHELTKAIVQSVLDDPNITALASKFVVLLFQMPETRAATASSARASSLDS